MKKQRTSLEKAGYFLSNLGGLIIILNFTKFKNSEWGLELSILAAVLALIGLFLILKSKKD